MVDYANTLRKQRSKPTDMGGLLALLSSNTHIDLLAQLAKVALATYRVGAIFTRQHCSGIDWIWVGGRMLLHRPKKRGGIVASEQVQILEQTFNPYGEGSNQYPVLTYEIGKTCALEFTSVGLPVLDGSGWTMKIISLTKLTDYHG